MFQTAETEGTRGVTEAAEAAEEVEEGIYFAEEVAEGEEAVPMVAREGMAETACLVVQEAREAAPGRTEATAPVSSPA